MHTRNILLFFPFIICWWFSPAWGQTISVETLKQWVIVTPPGAIESEKYAAEEFKSIFEQALGVSLKQVNDFPKNNKGYICIGQTNLFATGDLGEEGLKIVISPDRLFITGGRPRGVLYGVYEFFEKYLNVQFLTTDHTWIPENINEIKIPCETFNYVPPFHFRWSYFAENNNDPKFATRMRTNMVQEDKKYGGKCNWDLINHSFPNFLSVEKYGKDHPEYFMLCNGRRAVDFKDCCGNGPNPCYDNKDVLDIVTKGVRDYFTNHPEKGNVSLSCVDSHAHCECDSCQKVNALHGGTSGSHFEFINKIAKRIKADYPDKYIGTLAYYHTRRAPTNMKIEENVQIQLCSIECCTYHAINDPDCPENISFCKDLKDWSKICQNIMIWNYNVDFHAYDLPFPNLRSIGPNIRFFKDNHVTGVFMQGAGNSRNSDFCDLKNWVISQCLWKPGRSSWDLSLQFCKMHYGKAAGPIIEWLTLLHDHVALTNVHYDCFPTPRDMNLDVQMGVKALNLFRKAMDMADNEVIRSRVEKASLCAYRLIIDASPFVQQGDVYKLSLPPGYENVLETYKSLVVKYKTDLPSETGSYDAYFQKKNDYKRASIENVEHIYDELRQKTICWIKSVTR